MGSIYLRGNIYWIKYSREGRRFRELSESRKKSAAKRLLRIREGQIAQGRFAGLAPDRTRYEDLAKDLVNDYKPGLIAFQAGSEPHLLAAAAQQ